MNVCTNCFNDLELQSFIEVNSKVIGKCDYCLDNADSPLLDIKELLDFFADFLKIFQEGSVSRTLNDIVNEDWNLFSDSVISSTILSDVIGLLKYSSIQPSSFVSYDGEIIESTSHWKELKEILKHEKRYLTDLKKEMFQNFVSYFKIIEISSKEKKIFYRSRIHNNSGSEAYSIDKMGSPDKTKVSSGRANPLGIPYLYLSETPETTIYETRATFLDEISIGEFIVEDNQNLSLVDFTAKGEAFYNLDNIIEYSKSFIMQKSISSDLSKPIRKRYDSVLDYIPTQYICEFIRYEIGTDGILFNSSLHQGGKNIVLFNEDKVKCISVKKHHITDVSINSEIMDITNI